ncbi:hypothetical protein HPB48_015755 [Haemaphysalis longicornis]|uniref:Uncharacterized protein n=1 Tax=Haemaphysalis longicornis TaxID=44386 RepID=A0A9J6FRT4_HAELO|nr:hypothetical protein HPB48_015755 [Haemaphysalis longicornis]
MESQFKRGGETLCFENKKLRDLLRDTVTNYEPCPEEEKDETRKKIRTEVKITEKGQPNGIEEEVEEYYEGIDNCYSDWKGKEGEQKQIITRVRRQREGRSGSEKRMTKNTRTEGRIVEQEQERNKIKEVIEKDMY